MPIDDIFQYLRKVGGTDVLVFESAKKASEARDLIIDQLDKEGVAVDARPSLDIFESTLRMRLKPKETARATEPPGKAKAVCF